MYDFLLSEVWWMNTIIESLITGATAVLVAYVAYLGKVNKIMDNQEQLKEQLKNLNKEHGGLSDGHKGLSDGHKGLSDGHKGLSDEHKGLSDNIVELSKDNGKIISNTENIHEKVSSSSGTLLKVKELIFEDRVKQEEQYRHLKDDKKELFDKITSGAEAFKIIEKELLELNSKHIELKINFENLDKENSLLRKDKLLMKNELNNLKPENLNLKQENLNLKKEYKKIYFYLKDFEKQKRNEQQQEFENDMDIGFSM